METDSFGLGDWLKSIGGLTFFVGGLLPWWELVYNHGLTVRYNAFSYPLTGLVPYVVFVTIAILTVIIRTGSLRLSPILLDRHLTLLVATGAAVLVGVRFFVDGHDDGVAVDGLAVTRRGLGMYVAMASALIVVGGAVLGFRDRHRPIDDDDDDERGRWDDAEDDGTIDLLDRYADEQAPTRRPSQHPPLP